MNFKAFTLSTAMAALLATGAVAQTSTTEPSNPPVEVAPKANGAVSTTTVTSTTAESVQFTSSVSPDQMVVSKLTGTDVRNAAGENLGDINDIVLDASGKPTVAVIGVGGFLGIGEKNVGVPFQALTFTISADTKTAVARLDVTKEALKAAPTFVYADVTKLDPAAVKTQ